MGGLGGFEWLIIILVVLLLFGAKRIPELARGLGQGINEFRKASDEIKREIDEGAKQSNQKSNVSRSDNTNSEPSGSGSNAQSQEPQPDEQVEQESETTNKENKS